MDWNTIILGLLSGTSVGGLFEAWRYRKLNKQLKENETKQSNVETQKQELDLLQLYKDEMLKLFELMKQNQTENVGNQKEMMESLTNLDKRMDSMEVRMGGIESRIGDIETYLNGEYKNYLTEKRKL